MCGKFLYTISDMPQQTQQKVCWLSFYLFYSACLSIFICSHS